jgi:hypothetical protein
MCCIGLNEKEVDVLLKQDVDALQVFRMLKSTLHGMLRANFVDIDDNAGKCTISLLQVLNCHLFY